MSDPRLNAAAELVVQATTREVVTAFRAAAVPHIVLKGPLLRLWLFPEGDDHVSADVDLLVAPEAWSRAEAELERLGFEPLLLDIIPGDRPNHARPYARTRGGPSVDMHRTLLGAEASASVVWEALLRETDESMLGDTPVTVLNPAGQLLHVALHAAQNGADNERTLRYLERCIAITDSEAATGSLRIARAIEAIDAFALGLSLVPSGEALNATLGITPGSSVMAALRASSAPNTAHALEWLATRETYGDRARFVVHKIFPPRAFMTSSYARAHSRGGLILSYPIRWLWLASQFRSSLRAWHQARLISRHSDSEHQ